MGGFMPGWIVKENNLEPIELALHTLDESEGFEKSEDDFSHIYQSITHTTQRSVNAYSS